ncbi:MAG: response regulator [Gammaproteobacteria bacterium]|nr:response regulator [Gammaproteobacteria bacterium]
MNRPMILCVDQEMSNIMMLSMLLGGEDKYELAFSDCGYDCFDLIQYEKPDLIILDIQLPDSDGVELCRMLKESVHTRDIPVVVTTSLSTTNQIKKGIKAGADGYIIRPYHYQNVLNKVTELLAA